MKLKIKWTGNKIKCLWLKSSMIKLWWAKLRMINEEIIKSLGAEKKPLSSIEFLTFLNSEYLNHSEWLKAFFHLFVLMQIFIPKKNPWIWIAIISPVFLERWLIGSRLFHPPCRLLEMPLWMTSESDRTCHAGDRCWNTPQRHFWFQPLICFLDLFALRWFWFCGWLALIGLGGGWRSAPLAFRNAETGSVYLVDQVHSLEPHPFRSLDLFVAWCWPIPGHRMGSLSLVPTSHPQKALCPWLWTRGFLFMALYLVDSKGYRPQVVKTQLSDISLESLR